MKNKIILGCLAAATCEILFGLSFIFTKLGADLLDETAVAGEAAVSNNNTIEG